MTLATRTLTALAATAALAAPALAKSPAPLALDVFTAGAAGFHATSTLIQGEKEAVLVDAQFTRSEAHRLTAQILESGRKLTTVFVTHAHPDHHFGLEIVLAQFPDAKVVATPAVVDEIKAISAAKLAQWKPMYGTNLADTFVVPEPLTADRLVLEGRELRIVELQEGESEAAAALYVPSLQTLIAGDLVFNGVHLWLAEGRPEQWLANLERVRAAGPIKRVVAGHKRPGAADPASLLNANAEYIRTFVRIVRTSKSAEEALKRLEARYPGHLLPIIAEIAVKAYSPGSGRAE